MNYIVLGGGSAGWLTALFIKKTFPKSNVTLIRSKDIGIIGVGEATTPNIVSFLRFLDINLIDVINNTNGSLKLGISFENWNGDKKKYFHPFKDNVTDFKIQNLFGSECHDYYLKTLINKNLSFDDYIYANKLAYSNRVDLDNTLWALHFDANKFSTFLEKIGKERNINVIEGEYEYCTLSDDGKIKQINLKDKRSFYVDFIFDCSGFHRALIGEVYKQKWISYNKHLPMKRAIPFWIEHDNEEISPYTTSISMKYGWMWKIPLQNRIGSGYIFDSDFIDENEALSEAENFYNRKLEIRKVINFDAGRYENFWVKNCIAIGLSSSFIEPLESTSLFLSIGNLETLRHFVNEFEELNEHSIKLYNEMVTNSMSDTLDFICLHYITKRNDSEFWKNLNSNYPPTERVKELLSLIKSNNLRFFDTDSTKTPTKFSLYSIICVCKGLDLMNYGNIKNYENLIPKVDEYKSMIDNLFVNSEYHHEFLRKLKK
jgi:tryptophan halogenase